MSDYREVKACRLCDSTNLSVALDLGETPLANELNGTELFPLVVMRCGDCEHHQLSIAVAPERLWGPNYPYQSGTSPVFRAHLEKLADEVAALKPGGRVLEIASNDGTLVRMLADRGLGVAGIDPSGPEASDGGAGPGHWITMRGSWPEDVVSRGPGLDVIIALNVFAHVDDLHGFTAAVKEALAPDGVFIVEVGHAPNIWSRGIFDTIYHEHLSYHDLGSMSDFFKRHGLHIERSDRNNSQGGTVRAYVTHERKRAVSTRNRLGKVPQQIRHLKSDLQHALLGNVAGYGCPAKLTTLMYALELRPPACIFDDNPLKVGRTTPGMNIPIVPTSELLSRNPDTLILFSWNFASEIIPRLRAMGYRGRIVTPLPEVEIDEL